jgi:hypothetical protein
MVSIRWHETLASNTNSIMIIGSPVILCVFISPPHLGSKPLNRVRFSRAAKRR